MALQLNTTTSIVDYLKSTGQASDSKSISSLYTSSGLADRLGTYVGSGSQNTALLKSLSSKTSSSAIPPVSSIDTSSFTPEALTAFNNAKALIPGQATQPQQQQPPPPPTIGSSGITAEQARSSIPQTPSAEEILNSVLSSAGFQNFQQRQQLGKTLATGEAEAQKAKLESQTASDTKQFIDSMGRRGLFFSGETESGIKALVENLASSKLGIDRKLAGQLLESDFDTRDEILRQVEGIVKDAQQGRKEAISALEKVGLTVIGDQVVPTLAASKEQRIIEQQALQNEINAAKLELSMAKGDLAIQTATLRLERLQQQVVNNADAQVSSAAQQLTNAVGSDGYTDPNLYARLRQSSTINPTQFDNRFGYLINPLSRDRLGLSTASRSGLTPEILGAINDAKAVIDQAKWMGTGAETRDAVIQKYLETNNFDLSPYI